MNQSMRYFCQTICLVGLMAVSGASTALSLEQQRKDFLAAEKLLKKRKMSEFFAQSSSLKDYPLYPYLQYQWLRKDLHQHKEIEAFLLQHTDSRYAGLLKNKWLRQLAKDKSWQELVKHYRTSSSASLQCAYRFAQYQSGQQETALKAAKKLWTVGRSQPSSCDELFKRLMKSKYFTREMIWQRFQLALDDGKTGLAGYVKKLMTPTDQDVAELWIKVHKKPDLVKKQKNWHAGVAQAGLIFVHAIDRMAKTNLHGAISYWDMHRTQFTIPPERIDYIERRLALSLAYRKHPEAFPRLQKLRLNDEVVREWRIRAALNQQNWNGVDQALVALTEEEKADSKWQYWRARTLERSGQQEQADKLFGQLAEERSFYGFLSANRLNKSLNLSHTPIQVSEEQMAQLLATKGFKVIEELRALNRDDEARRQWWYMMTKLNKQDIKTAAKIAQAWQWDQIAIFTVAKAKYWDDVDLRFPMKFVEQVKKNASQQKLDPAIVYGIIRRESAFNDKAVSRAGARGLMQIMPNTGKQIARELKEKWKSKASLFNPELNVKYGTFYYKKLLNQFNGHYALAAAAYNAGPHRVLRWLPKEKSIATDVWVETIPFKETRAYVAAVLSYAMIYQKRMQRNALKIEDFILEIPTAKNLS